MEIGWSAFKRAGSLTITGGRRFTHHRRQVTGQPSRRQPEHPPPGRQSGGQSETITGQRSGRLTGQYRHQPGRQQERRQRQSIDSRCGPAEHGRRHAHLDAVARHRIRGIG